MGKYSYCVLFRIRHPSVDPGELTTRLAMKPHRFWKVGERRTAPNGRVLKGYYPDTAWSYKEEYEGRSRNFFKKTERLVRHLKRHKNLLHDISATGGKCEIYIQLPGSTNIGDSLPPKMLRLLAELDILLSVEVFPKWRNAV